MKKRTLLLSVLLTLSALLFAVPVDRERAKDVAKLFLQKQIVNGGQNRAPQKLSLDEVNVSQYDGKLFVFNTASGGFIVVSANDVAYPILGYSDENTLKLPPLLKLLVFGLFGNEASNFDDSFFFLSIPTCDLSSPSSRE